MLENDPVPLLLIPLLLLLVVLLAMLLLPWSIRQRYRAGTARRQARGWIASINVWGIGISAVILLVTAAISSAWISGAFTYTLAGMAGGIALGVIGVRLIHWERNPGALNYTPNRWLVLGITVAVAGRIGFGMWRMWQAWQLSGRHGEPWLAASGLAGSMAAGALVLGYYLAFWMGIWFKAREAVRGIR